MVRPMHELLEIMLSQKKLFDNTNLYKSGLCSKAVYLYDALLLINNHEFFKLRKYIEENRPSKYSSFDAFKHRNSTFYWDVNNQKARIKWLKKHIKHTRYNHLNCIPNGK